MDKQDIKWITEVLNTIGLPMIVLDELKHSEIERLWNVLSRFFGDVTTSDEYNKLKEE